MWHVSSRSGVVLVAQTAIRFLTLPYNHANWVASRRTTQFAVAATSRSALLSSDETHSEVR